MSFRYILRDPNGRTFTAATRDEAETILDRLQADFQNDEIEIEADVVADESIFKNEITLGRASEL